MIDPNHELFRWGPIPGKPIYVSYFMISITESFPRKYKCACPEIFFYFIQDKMTFICDYQELRDSGKKHFFFWIMDNSELKKVKKSYNLTVRRLHKIYQKLENLERFSDKDFFHLFKKWQEAYLLFWDHGLVPEVANWGGEQVLKDKLTEIGLSQEQFILALEKLTAPEKLSFYQEEELAFLKVKEKENSTDEKKYTTALRCHAQKYFWLGNSYYETIVLDEKQFEEKLKELNCKDVKGEIEKIKQIPKRAKEEKKKILREFNIGNDIKKIAQRLSYCIWWQDARKKQIFIANHYLTLFLKEISRRRNISLPELQLYWGKELENLLQGNFLPQKEIERRKQKFLGHYNTSLKIISKAKVFAELVNPFIYQKVDENVKEIKGTVASLGLGKVKGKVKILLNPKESDKLKTGEILIAPFTSPEYIVAMRKAAAIVTDEGGMTSHAAIVSRELGIPCIVGTRIATKVLKDGDKVEINAEKGIIRKIKNS